MRMANDQVAGGSAQQQTAAQHATEVASGDRFAFGRNWARYLEGLTDERIQNAEKSLQKMLGLDSLAGMSFIDIGSGSGLFSLAARRLGARVHSLDYDTYSFGCTRELRRRFFPEDQGWTVEQASVLDEKHLRELGRFDIVYSWGVLHHTGSMWEALANVAPLVNEGGYLFIAIYNDQGKTSRRWLAVKKTYNRLPQGLRFIVLWPSFIKLWWRRLVKDAILLRPTHSWREYKRGRGMSAWADVVDWVGGYPFEVAKPEEIFDFYRQRGFSLERLKTEGGDLGCNEFVFRKSSR
jgi:2-polyprenyl-3-methyl-5-hydroxy-6-metoxy-1,4-benzoquinol methylase